MFNSLRTVFVFIGATATMTAVAFAGSSPASMVKVPEGDFLSGPNKTKVHVKAFEIDKTEVTNAQFKEFNKDFTIPEGKENHPVAEVTYFEAEDFCKSVGKRLPTALEWEKAARGTDGRTYPWGSKADASKANVLEGGKGTTIPAGSIKEGASPCGALDMSGNVWEWVNDYADTDKQYRVLIGGSFFDDINNATVYSKLRSIPDDPHEYYGFRCAK